MALGTGNGLGERGAGFHREGFHCRISFEYTMSLPEIEQYRVKKVLSAFCDRRIPPQYRKCVRLGYRIRGNKVILFAERPGFEEPDDPSQLKSAEFEYCPESRRWTLYHFDRRNRRRPYQALPLGQDLTRLVAEVDADPTGAFWD